MRDIGMVRDLDQLGRVVLPREFRHTLNISPKDYLEIYVEGDTIVLKKYSDKCEFCGSRENTTVYRDKLICNDCMNGLIEIKKKKEAEYKI